MAGEGSTVTKPPDEREDWASLANWTDIGPFGWFAGLVAGLFGWLFSRRKKGV